jgi:hypothetical protein
MTTTPPADRAVKLAETRRLKMARSAHAYVRGSTAKFYEWLEASPGDLPEGPPIWICGDCHIGNLGPLADSKGRVAVQIRDLDQTVIGNPAHDLIRLGLSLASAARGADLPGVTTARILEQLMVGYEAALSGDFDRKGEKAMRPGPIRGLLARSVRRRWRQLAAERLDTVKPMVPLGRKFWALTAEERRALAELFATDEMRGLITQLQARDDDDRVSLVDAAYWMKGCSSLGRLRYAAMLRIGQGSRSSLCLVDIKEATAAAAPRSPTAQMPRGDRRPGALAELGRADDRDPPAGQERRHPRADAAGPEAGSEPANAGQGDGPGGLSRRRRRPRPRPPDVARGAQSLAERPGQGAADHPGRARLAMVQRRLPARDPRARLPRTLPAFRAGAGGLT